MKTLLFDLDGTLIDSRADLTSAVNCALQAAGRPPKSQDEVVPHVGNGLQILLKQVLGPSANGALKLATEAFIAYYDAHCVDETTLYDGVLDGLNDLKTSARFAVVTNKPAGFAKKIIERLDLSPLLPVVIGGDSLAERKPHPAPFLKALHDLGGEAASALVVGDGPQDVKGGQAAGLKTCVAQYGYGYAPSLLELKPDYTIKAFKELKEIVLWQR